jgi:peptide chain release factor 1
MFDKLSTVESQYEDLMTRLGTAEVQSDQAEYRKAAKQLSDLEPLVQKYREYKGVQKDIEGSEELVGGADPDMRQLAEEELKELQTRREAILGDLRMLLVPKDPNDEKNVILEIRAGTGGDEAALFAADLFRMYSRFAERQRWRLEVMSSSESGTGGLKEVIASIEGRGVYSRMKYESGVHRVQRVPATEASGRIHTSTATVAVMPEVEDIEVELDENDLKVDVYRSTGPGGQSVNTTDSAVRITHVPTGVVVSMQDEKSQLQNRVKALRVLRARLYELERERRQAEVSAARRLQIGGGERAEKIRTYNYPDSRVTDHRVKVTLNLEKVLPGALDEFTEALQAEDRRRALETAAV